MTGSQDHLDKVERWKDALRARQQAQAELAAEGWKPPVDVGSLGRQLARGVPAPEYVVEGLIPAGANVLLNAQYKKGKTTAALNLVRAGADGEPLFGHFNVKPPGNIAWWNAEVHPNMALLWLGEMKVRHPRRVFPLHLRGHSMPLAVEDARTWAVRWLRKHKIKWWVVDPFGALFDGEENSNSEVRNWLRALDEVKRRAGVEVLVLVAHTGHDAQDDDAIVRARGAARLMDWPDVIWTYRAGNEEDSTRRYLSAMGRDVEVPEMVLDFDAATRTLTKVNGVSGRAADRRVSLAVKAAEVVKTHHERTGSPMNKNALTAALAGKANYKRSAIDYAVQVGWIVLETGDNRQQLHLPGAEPVRLDGMGRGIVLRGGG